MMMTAMGFAIMWAAGEMARGQAMYPAGARADEVVVVRAMGTGYPPKHLRGVRARLMAQRAAEVVAVRNLARQLGYGPRAVVQGFRYVSASVNPNGSVTVVVEKRTGQ